MKTNPSISVLTFEFCRTEELSDGLEIASITRVVHPGEENYAARIVSHWGTLLQGEGAFRTQYIRHFIECLQVATQPKLRELFVVGAQVSTGPIRGRLEFQVLPGDAFAPHLPAIEP